ncbi:MAG: hypothetical protein IKJ68_00840 [Clostridia bacterium]|nr:hypothetical protein [Clostridia bacterium]
MLMKYILDNYNPGEPIIASDIQIGLTEVNKRKQFKTLTDNGFLKRFDNGIYYIPKKSKLGGEVSVPPDVVVEKKYVYRNNKVLGYYSGCTFANQIGISTQVPYVQEIVTNEMGNPIKKLDLGGRTFILRKARTKITEDNVKVLQLLDLLKDIETYAELKGEEMKECLSNYISANKITKEIIDIYLPLFPDKIYKSIYETGISNVLA